MYESKVGCTESSERHEGCLSEAFNNGHADGPFSLLYPSSPLCHPCMFEVEGVLMGLLA
jgi:hypothetical protein